MKSWWNRMTPAVLAMLLAGFMASPVKAQDADAEAAAIAAIEGRLLQAQTLIATGRLDDGMRTLQGVLAQVTPEMANRVAFIEKLADVRMADWRGNSAKVLEELEASLTLATQADQKEACCQLSLALAQASVAAYKPEAAALLDFISEKIVSDMQQATSFITLAKLYITIVLCKP